MIRTSTPKKRENKGDVKASPISLSKSITLVFQGKSSEEIECGNDKIILNSADMKSFEIKPGQLVSIDDILIFQAWPSSKGLISKHGLIGKLWSSNFETNMKDRKVSISSIAASFWNDCDSILISYSPSKFELPAREAIDFKKYCHAMLNDAIFINKACTISCLLSWNGVPQDLKLTPTTVRPESPSLVKITSRTKLILQTEENHDISHYDHQDKLISDIIVRVRSKFGGYIEVVKSAAAVMAMGLLSLQQLRHNHLILPSSMKRPRGLLLYGPSGVGKSTLIRQLLTAFNYNTISITLGILAKKYVGEAEAELRMLLEDAKSSSPSCVVIDDIDTIFRDRAAASDEQRKLVTTLLTFMDGVSSHSVGNEVFFLASTSRPQNIDRALRRPGRLDVELELPVPSSQERLDILSIILKSMQVLCISEADVEGVAKVAHGMVASDLELLVKEAFLIDLHAQTDPSTLSIEMNQLSLETEASAPVVLKKESLYEAVKKVSPSALREITIEVPNVKWTDIGGMSLVKESLREVVEWPLLYSNIFESMNISPPRGVLLYGPPGCSKTLMAKALATETSMNFLAVRGPELLSKWLGESEKAIQTLFRRARAAAPSIVFFDEIDALTGKRGEASAGVNDRVLSQLLTEIDGVQEMKRVLVVAATNRPDLIDKALLRPGRIDRKIFVGPPDDLSRKQILNINLTRLPVGEDVNVDELVAKSEGFSGAEVVSICSEAAFLAMDEDAEMITQQHLMTILLNMKPQITSSMIEFYDNIQNTFKL